MSQQPVDQYAKIPQSSRRITRSQTAKEAKDTDENIRKLLLAELKLNKATNLKSTPSTSTEPQVKRRKLNIKSPIKKLSLDDGNSLHDF